MRLLRTFLAVFALATFAGCASYHLGPVKTDVAGKSVEVLPFNNRTLQPRLGDALTQALRQRIQTDATCRLATHGEGDIILSGLVTRYERAGLGYSGRDAVTPENFNVEVTVEITARERSTGRILLEREIKGRTLVHVGGDLASAERQAMPLLAADLAQNITGLLTEGSW